MPSRIYTGLIGPKAGGVDFRIPGLPAVFFPDNTTPVEVTADQAKALDATGQVAPPKATKAAPKTSEED